jgi:hypothetical protein
VPDVAELLAAYDAQVRGRIPDPLPRGVTVERDGPLVRCFGLAGRGVLYRDLGGLEGGDLNELISRQVRVFAERGERFEWKLHGHDRPRRPATVATRGGIRSRGHGDGRDRPR